MGKFCTNCGNELNEIQDICLKCGALVPKENNNLSDKKKTHNGYIKTSSIIMIVLGSCMVLGANANSSLVNNIFLVFILPGLAAIISGILALCSKNNKKLLLISGILLIVGAIINFFGIIDISIFIILAVLFGIFNIIYSREEKKINSN